jgi:type II secretion system protein N
LRAKFPDQPPQKIDRALVRPAWSLSWFVGEPVLHVELESPSGSADGTLRWNGLTAWAGTIRNARPELPPVADWIPTGSLEGNLEATLDVSMAEQGPEGRVEFEIQDGSLSLPGLSVPLPFTILTGELVLGGDAYATLTSLSFEGPDASGSGSGKIGRAERLEQAPIGFEFALDIKPTISRMVSAGGLKVNPGGDALAKISGTVGKPKIR